MLQLIQQSLLVPSWLQAHALLVISVPMVDNKTAMGRTNTIITSEKITSFHDNTSINTDGVNDDVIKINTVETKMEDIFSIK